VNAYQLREYFDHASGSDEEQIHHHVKEEEGAMFPEAKRAKLDKQSVGAQMAAGKLELKSTMSSEVSTRSPKAASAKSSSAPYHVIANDHCRGLSDILRTWSLYAGQFGVTVKLPLVIVALGSRSDRRRVGSPRRSLTGLFR
jgi:hypothetical protein